MVANNQLSRGSRAIVVGTLGATPIAFLSWLFQNNYINQRHMERLTRMFAEVAFDHAGQVMQRISREVRDMSARTLRRLYSEYSRERENDEQILPHEERGQSMDIEPVESIEVEGATETPVLNLPASTTMPDASTQTNGVHETPLDRITRVERGVPNYVYASLPYDEIYLFDQSRFATTFAYRMTSCYDTKVDIGTTSDLNGNSGSIISDATNQGGTSDAYITKARWFDFYASMYKYYSVVGCKWSMVFENLTSEPLWVHHGYCGNNNPPTDVATNIDILHWPGYSSHYVKPQNVVVNNVGIQTKQLANNAAQFEDQTNALGDANSSGISGAAAVGNNGMNTLQLSGSYAPGDFTRDINQDGEVELWSLCSTNPVLLEKLLFIVKPETSFVSNNSVLSNNRQLRFRYHIKLEYLVEFKELLPGLKYPVSHQPATLSINQTITQTNVTQPGP